MQKNFKLISSRVFDAIEVPLRYSKLSRQTIYYCLLYLIAENQFFFELISSRRTKPVVITLDPKFFTSGTTVKELYYIS